jgi:uncharacterized membrane protein YvbJ
LPYCDKCGAKLEENAHFCQKCGAPVTPVIYVQPPAPRTQTHPTKPLTKDPMIILALVLVTVLIVALVVAVIFIVPFGQINFGSNQNNQNLNKISFNYPTDTPATPYTLNLNLVPLNTAWLPS